MRTPHTHYRKGKRVWLRLRDGTEYTGKFIEWRGRFVIFEGRRFETRELAAMGHAKISSAAPASPGRDRSKQPGRS